MSAVRPPALPLVRRLPSGLGGVCGLLFGNLYRLFSLALECLMLLPAVAARRLLPQAGLVTGEVCSTVPSFLLCTSRAVP